MAIFPIRVYPDPVLRSEAALVEVFDDELRRLTDDMLETMYDAPGVGLAAPQIGISKRVFVADIGDGPFVMINPEIVETDGEWMFEEGCLSIPEHWWEFARPSYARAVGQDLDGNTVEYEGDELMGRVLQHETDHLYGKLLIDRLPRRERKEALAVLREAMAENRLGRD
jgi:peptide deformylase